MDKSKKYMIICICILFFSIVGSTVAYYVGVYFRISANTITHGLDYYINYTKGQNITSGELVATSDYLQGKSTSIKLWKKDNTYDLYGHIYLDINSIGTNISNSEALRYTVVNNNIIIDEGTVKGVNGRKAGDSVLIASNIPLQTSEQTYTIYLWLDSGVLLDSSFSAENLSMTVRCEVTMKKIDMPVYLINYIRNLYTSGNPTLITQEVSNDSYYYSYQDESNTWGLMNDGLTIDTTQDATTTGYAKVVTDTEKLTKGTEGNIRYFGASDKVNNYIYFNCSDYSNQSSSTCERWRIIGIVDGKVKIIRDESIGNMAWDFDYNDDLSSESYSHEWSESSLKKLLNTSYYNGDTSGTVKYYSLWLDPAGEEIFGGELVELQLNMNKIGIKNNITRNFISPTSWYLGKIKDLSLDLFPNDLYINERTDGPGNSYYGEHSFLINENIGLMNASDYAYATDLGKCSVVPTSYNSNTNSFACILNNWLFKDNIKLQWIINQTTQTGVIRDGNLFTNNEICSGTCAGIAYTLTLYHNDPFVFPTLYLEPELGIKLDDGDGSYDTPYKISVR